MLTSFPGAVRVVLLTRLTPDPTEVVQIFGWDILVGGIISLAVRAKDSRVCVPRKRLRGSLS